jgi:hypothetical protein
MLHAKVRGRYQGPSHDVLTGLTDVGLFIYRRIDPLAWSSNYRYTVCNLIQPCAGTDVGCLPENSNHWTPPHKHGTFSIILNLTMKRLL